MEQISFSGYIGAGLWQEFSIENDNTKKSLKDVHKSKIGKAHEFFDLYVVDNSISNIAERGEFLRCQKLSINEIVDGDIVVVRRQNKSLSQIIIKRCIQQSDTLSLVDIEIVPATSDNMSDYNQSAPITRNNNEIIGRVASKYKPIG